MQVDYDLVIVGSGIIGAHSFYQASQLNPRWKIAILDKNLKGGGVSFFSAGVDVPIGRSILHRQLTDQSRLIYKNYKDKWNNFPINPIDTLWVVPRSKVLEFKKNVSNTIFNDGSQWELSGLNSNLTLSAADHLFCQQGNHFGNVMGVINFLITATMANTSNRVLEGFNVLTIKRNKEAYCIYSKSDYRINANRVIVTLGPWLNNVMPGGWKQKLKKIVSLHIDAQPTKDDKLIFFYETGNFLLPLYEQGYWLLSITSWEWGGDLHQKHLDITNDEIELGKMFLKKYIPTFASKVMGGRVFCDGYTHNRIPIVTKHPMMNDVILVYGASGSGYRLAPGLAEQALRFYE